MSSEDRLAQLKYVVFETFKAGLTSYAQAQQISIDEDVLTLGRDVVEAIFADNSSRMLREFEKIDKVDPRDQWMAGAVSLGAAMVSLSVANAQREKKHRLSPGHLFLALFDLGKIHVWPWTE